MGKMLRQQFLKDDISIITKAEKKKYRNNEINILNSARSLFQQPNMSKLEMLNKYRNMDDEEKRYFRIFIRKYPD